MHQLKRDTLDGRIFLKKIFSMEKNCIEFLQYSQYFSVLSPFKHIGLIYSLRPMIGYLPVSIHLLIWQISLLYNRKSDTSSPSCKLIIMKYLQGKQNYKELQAETFILHLDEIVLSDCCQDILESNQLIIEQTFIFIDDIRLNYYFHIQY